MHRNLLIYLNTWLGAHDRKPLVLRGARQVGKTWIVRELAKNTNKNLNNNSTTKKIKMSKIIDAIKEGEINQSTSNKYLKEDNIYS